VVLHDCQGNADVGGWDAHNDNRSALASDADCLPDGGLDRDAVEDDIGALAERVAYLVDDVGLR
jgi:hypothetical protein